MNSRKKRALTGFSLILMYVFGFLVVWSQIFQYVIVKGESMEPTYKDGDRVWACSFYLLVGPIQPGDIVVIRDDSENTHVIKRVHRVGGQSVDLAMLPTDRVIFNASGEYVVPEDHYYVLGDNIWNSTDSRSFGPVPKHAVIGKVVPITFGGIVIAAIPVVLCLAFALSRPSGSRITPEHVL